MIDVNDTRIPAAVRAKAAATPAKEKINNADRLSNSGLTIVHVNNPVIPGVYRALTIAYERINKSHLRISTAVTHRSDTFTKKIGTRTALNNFEKGNTIVIPADNSMPVATQLREMFGFIR